jgi:ferredoxin
MSLKINEYCVACGWCQQRCRNGAIKEGKESYIIDADRCTECVGWYKEPRCVEVCFMSACEPEPYHKESYDDLLAKFKRLYPNKIPQVI